MVSKKKPDNRYAALIDRIFRSAYRPGMTEVPFHRAALIEAAKALQIELPKNLGDVIYSMRYRTPLPKSIRQTESHGKNWVIEGTGRSKYAFRLVAISLISPNSQLAAIKIPDATPEIVGAYALSDEQALLAKVRYNRLLDIFLGVAAYSLQNHLRTTVRQMGQVEIDEVYVAVDKRGRQYIIPVQAKGGGDRLSSVQTKQDIACCRQKFPGLLCRAISAQFVSDDLIALFELSICGENVRIVDERHYKLVPANRISDEDLKEYNK